MPRKHVKPEKQLNADAEVRLAETPDQTETGMYGPSITFGVDDSRLTLTTTRLDAGIWKSDASRCPLPSRF